MALRLFSAAHRVGGRAPYAISAVATARRVGGRGPSLIRAIATQSLPDLPYDYGALQPVIIPEIMELHHKKHHQAYVSNLNKALEQYAEADHKGDLKTMISLQPAIKFNGGGHINHAMFWQMLCPVKDYAPPQGKLEQDIIKTWGSVDLMIQKFNAVAGGVQGSGWGWLAYNKDLKTIQLATTANQDPLQGTTGLIPLLGIDCWEHAFYLQYKNSRPDYLKEIWKVVNWADVSWRYDEATKAHTA